MLTPAHSQATLTEWCIDFASTSEANAAPAWAKTSPSPVASTVHRAKTAWRPSLDSNTMPRTWLSSTIDDTPRVKHDPDAELQRHAQRLQLEPLRIDERRPGHDIAERAESLAPVRVVLRVLGAPLLLWRAGDAAFGESIEDVDGEAFDHLATVPIRHPVDPDDESAGGQAAKVAIALDQEDVRAGAVGRDRRGAAGRPAAHDQDVGFGKHGQVARGLVVGPRRTRAASVRDTADGQNFGGVASSERQVLDFPVHWRQVSPMAAWG